jgi:hypothetical protein
MTADAISASVSTGSGGAWAQAVYSGSGILGRSLEVHYRYVGGGEGSYSYDEETGEYYPDPDGDWEVYYTPGEAGDLRVQATLDADFTTGGVAGPGLDGSLSLESTGGDDRLQAFLLAGAFGNGPGGYSTEVSPFLRSPGAVARLLRVRLRIGRTMTEYSGAGERIESERTAEAVEGLDLSDWLALDLMERVRRTEQELYETRRIDEYRGQADPSLRSQTFSPGLLLGLERRIERVSGTSGTMYEIEPHVTWNRSGWSSYGSLGASFIESDAEIPLWLFGGMTGGSNLSASARITRTVASGLEVSLTYYGRRIAGSEWTHRGGLDGTVTF